MGNTVGSWEAKSTNDLYCLGLWCADKYYWSSSVGLTTSSIVLLGKFFQFLLEQFPLSRLRLRIYVPENSEFSTNFLPEGLRRVKRSICEGKKHLRPAFQIYVNSRPFLRDFQNWEENRSRILSRRFDIFSFFGGRFDGDGSVSPDLKTDCRIVYENRKEAEIDGDIARKAGFETTIYEYRTSNTYCLYFGWGVSERFMRAIEPFSVKVQHGGKLP